MSERCSLIPSDLKAAAAAASTKMAGQAFLSLTPQRCLSWSGRIGAYCFDFVARDRRAGAGFKATCAAARSMEANPATPKKRGLAIRELPQVRREALRRAFQDLPS